MFKKRPRKIVVNVDSQGRLQVIEIRPIYGVHSIVYYLFCRDKKVLRNFNIKEKVGAIVMNFIALVSSDSVMSTHTG